MVIFNINEVLTFGLLIMLNRILWIPFLPVPMVNFGLASLMLDHSKLVLHADLVHWTTPALIKVYWASEGNWSLVLLQLVLIILGAPLYWPFVQRFLRVTNMPQPIAGIHGKFNLADLLSYRERIGFGKKHSDYWNYRLQLFDDIRTIENNKPKLLYQPLVWVAQDVKNQLLRHQGKMLYISTNINLQTLSFSSATTHLSTTFTGLPVRFEIVERGFFQSISTDHWRGRPCKNRPFFNRTTPYQAGLRFVEPSVCYVQQTRSKNHCRGLRNSGSV